MKLKPTYDKEISGINQQRPVAKWNQEPSGRTKIKVGQCAGVDLLKSMNSSGWGMLVDKLLWGYQGVRE